MMSLVSIDGLSKAKVLAALYNNAKPQGMGLLHYTPEVMTESEAVAVLKATYAGGYLYFDYLDGRVMKVDLTNDAFESRLYNRDNGEGAAERVIAELRSR